MRSRAAFLRGGGRGRGGVGFAARFFAVPPGEAERVLGSVVIDLPRAFLAVAREVRDGSFVPRVETFGLAGGVLRYAPNPALTGRGTAALLARVAAARDSILAGSLQPLAAR